MSTTTGWPGISTAQQSVRTIAGGKLGVQEGQQASSPQVVVGCLAQQACHQPQPPLRLLHIHLQALHGKKAAVFMY